MEKQNLETKYNKWIVVLSVAIPLVVALLFGVNLRKLGYDVEPLSFSAKMAKRRVRTSRCFMEWGR